MKVLLNDRFAPITSSAGFLEAELGTVVDAFYSWRKSLGSGVVNVPLRESFPDVLHQLEPLTTVGVTRELLLPTQSSWTAYFNNASGGTDAFGPIGHFCEVLHCRGLMVTCVRDTISGNSREATGQYGAVMFSLWGPEQQEWLNLTRGITAMNDGGRWIFETNGAVQPFEQVERYGARRIADRFTADMLEEYCAAIGVRYFDPAFYGPGGVLIQTQGDLPPGAEALTLSEVQRRHGIGPMAES